jgi:hypothetical protein
MVEPARPALRDGLRVVMARGFYDGGRDPKRYRDYGLWSAGQVPLGTLGTVRPKPAEFRHGPPWCIEWDGLTPKPGRYFGAYELPPGVDIVEGP